MKSEKWQFMHTERLGYLTTDPKNLGTALKLTVRIRLPKLTNDGRLSALLKSLNLDHKYNVVKETEEKIPNESSQNKKSSIVEISSVQTLGKSEVHSPDIYFLFKTARLNLSPCHFLLLSLDRIFPKAQTF